MYFDLKYITPSPLLRHLQGGITFVSYIRKKSHNEITFVDPAKSCFIIHFYMSENKMTHLKSIQSSALYFGSVPSRIKYWRFRFQQTTDMFRSVRVTVPCWHLVSYRVHVTCELFFVEGMEVPWQPTTAKPMTAVRFTILKREINGYFKWRLRQFMVQ